MRFGIKGTILSFSIGFLGFFIDRAHKYYQLNIEGWSGGEFIRITSFFDYMMIWNKGVSFGLFGSLPAWVMFLIIGVALLALIIWWVKAETFLTQIALSLCIGGAISNAIDRQIYGAVADFFHLHIGQYSFFVFNIADAVIFIGVMLLFFDMFFTKNTNIEQSQ